MNSALDKNKVLLGVTGSIAAYKSAELARVYVKRGYQVQVVMTESAQKFIAPLTFESITGNKVTTGFWDTEQCDIEHITQADWADIVVVAPASASFIAKAANGIADSPLLAILLATKAPVVIAPAMNVNMLAHPKTQQNISELQANGIGVVESEEGDLACGWQGAGRMAEPWEIFYKSQRSLSIGDFRGKKVIVAAGPTREPIDPVRFISNRSSGKMGMSIAREAYRRGADVTLVHGPVPIRVSSGIKTVAVVTAQEMYDTMLKLSCPETEDKEATTPDVVIMTAAVSDFKPKSFQDQKIKKSDALENIELDKNPDILSSLGEKRAENKRPILVGFAVETGEIDDLIEEATNKLRNKNADIIIGNFAEDAFDLDTNRVWIIENSGKREEVATSFKSRIAQKILNRVAKL